MNEQDILDYAAKIRPRHREAEAQAREILENKVKPLGSLGVLEDLAAVMAGIYEKLDYHIEKKADVIFCADNGVFDEGFNKYPQQISRLVAEIMAVGKGGGSLLATALGAQVKIINLGLKGDYTQGRCIPEADLTAGRQQESIRIVDRIICPQGTGNITQGPALTREQVCLAMAIGIEEAESLIDEGISVLSAGEIGLGNTATSAAILAALTGATAQEVTGMGSGSLGQALDRKVASVAKALAVNRPDPQDVIGVLSKIGGLDIAAMTGLYLACGRRRIPVVLDGFISLAAALCAVRLQPAVKEFMILSHHSAEKGAGLAARALGLNISRPDQEAEPALPPLHMGMRLGEGTGAVLMFPLLDCARQVLTYMASFDDLDRWFPGWR